MWTVELFVDELECVRRCLGLERLHLFGNSWGMVAMEYALTQPKGLASIVIESSPASIPRRVSEANRSASATPRRSAGGSQETRSCPARPTIPKPKRR